MISTQKFASHYEQKTTVVKFSASWCGPCKNEKFLNDYNSLKNEYVSNPQVMFVESDVDVDAVYISGYCWTVNSVPLLKIFRQGKEISSYSGTSSLVYVERDLKKLF